MKTRILTPTCLLLALATGAALRAAPAPAPFGAVRAADRGVEHSERYREGQKALDERNWSAAAEIFAELAQSGGAEGDAATYWNAYSLYKQNRHPAALRALEELARKYPTSRWADDAKALEVEVRKASGQATRPEDAEDEELKLYVLSNLIHVDSARVVPVLEEILQGDHSPRLKERALFVLSQSDSPQALETLVRIARGQQNPELAIKAIEMLGLHDKKDSVPRLEQIYGATQDNRVRAKVLEALMLADADQTLLRVARSESDPSLRLKAIEQLGLLDAVDGLQTLYREEKDLRVRTKIVEAFYLADRADILEEIAATDPDPSLRRKAIEGLGLVGGDEGLPALQRLYKKVSERELKVKILESFFLQDAHEPLIEAIRTESDRELRKKALEYLALIGSPEAADYLLGLLEGKAN
jgi:HEAT repeat protein